MTGEQDGILLPTSWQRLLAWVESGHLTRTVQRYERGRPVPVFWAQCSCGWRATRTWSTRKDAWQLDGLLHRMWEIGGPTCRG